MNLKKILAMILVLSLLVIGGVMQIAAQQSNNPPQGTSEEEISSSTNASDLDNIEEELEEQDAGDESVALEPEEEKGTEVENDGIVHEFEGEEEHED